MIFTCTMNPSLDYYMEFDNKLEDNKQNRSSLEYYEAGGKGINVSIVLNNLGIPSNAFGFVGGFTKDFYISLLAKYENIRPHFTYTDGHTRINVKCTAENSTDLNAAGPVITPEAMDNLAKKTERLAKGDYFIIAGVTQDYLEDRIVDLMKEMIASQVEVVLDTNPNIIKAILPCHPFLVKTTPGDLCALYGEAAQTQEEIVALGKRMVEDGAKHVIILLGNTHAILCMPEGVYESELIHAEKAVSFVGIGDSMVAGFVMNYIRTKDAIDSFRFGATCGTATLYSKGLATREMIDNLYEDTKVEQIA